jgi:hypothetical protein
LTLVTRDALQIRELVRPEPRIPRGSGLLFTSNPQVNHGTWRATPKSCKELPPSYFHASAWKVNSRNFAFTEFSEVATRIHQKFIDSC